MGYQEGEEGGTRTCSPTLVPIPIFALLPHLRPESCPAGWCLSL